MADDPRLKIAQPKEVVRQLIAGGYLSEEPSSALVTDLLEIQRAGVNAGGMGLRSPTTLIPCLLDSLWDEDAGCLRSNLDLSLFIEWVGGPIDIGKKRTLPKKLTHARTPSCTDSISDPAGVLRNRERWPIHLCDMEFLRQSTESWGQTQAFKADTLNNYRWASMYPVPIGRRALTENREVDKPSEWSEVLDVLPFEGDEKAMWALRVEIQGSSTFDLFGLADYPTESHKHLGVPVAGELAYAVRGHGRLPIDVLDAAETWWAQFRGLTLRGRPKGTGTWPSPQHFEIDLGLALARMRSQGEKVTQEQVSKRLNIDKRTLVRWLRHCGRSWQEI